MNSDLKKSTFFFVMQFVKIIEYENNVKNATCIYLISTGIMYGKDWWAYSLVKKDQQIYIRQLTSEDVLYM